MRGLFEIFIIFMQIILFAQYTSYKNYYLNDCGNKASIFIFIPSMIMIILLSILSFIIYKTKKNLVIRKVSFVFIILLHLLFNDYDVFSRIRLDKIGEGTCTDAYIAGLLYHHVTNFILLFVYFLKFDESKKSM